MEKFKALMTVIESYVTIMVILMDQRLNEDYTTSKWYFHNGEIEFSLQGKLAEGTVWINLFNDNDDLLVSLNRSRLGDKTVLEALADTISD